MKNLNARTISLLILSFYCIYLLTIISISIRHISNNSDIGRYQSYGDFVINTQTGRVYQLDDDGTIRDLEELLKR